MNKPITDLAEESEVDMRLSDIFGWCSMPVNNPDKSSYFTPAPDSDEQEKQEEKVSDIRQKDKSMDSTAQLAQFPHLDDEGDIDLDDDILGDGGIDDDELDEYLDIDDDIDAQNYADEGNLLLMVRGLNKSYTQGGNDLKILNNVDVRIYSGEIAALVGPSGSGKSTLLQILGLLDSPTSGKIMMGNDDVSTLSDAGRTKLRNEHIGFIYQFHHLLPEFTALENVAMPQIIAGKTQEEAMDKASDFLNQLGLSHRMSHRPATLSGGEQQRVAIARALVNEPYLLFADEPTGNLDPKTSDEVFDILLNQVRARGIGALIATHNMELAAEMDRILEVKAGRVVPY